MKICNQKNSLIKKAVLLTTAGAFAVTAGFFAMNLPQSVASAASYGYHHRGEYSPDSQQRGHYGPGYGYGYGYREMSADDTAADMAERFNLKKEEILKFNKEGWSFRNLHQAAYIASVGQKSLGDVLNAKTTTNTWRDVRESFGITREQMRAAEEAQFSARMAQRLQLDAGTVKNLLDQGYYPRDIAIASALSKKADKSLDNVLAMKKINNRWSDVAETLGISQADFDQLLWNRDGDYGPGFGPCGGYHRGYNDARIN